MIRLIGWLAVFVFLAYTGILQFLLVATGSIIVWFGMLIASLGGSF